MPTVSSDSSSGAQDSTGRQGTVQKYVPMIQPVRSSLFYLTG